MRKPEIIFYHSKEKEKKLLNELSDIGDIYSFSLDQPLPAGIFIRKQSLIVMYDSSRDGKGMQTLKAIRRQLPNQPLILILKHPNTNYLMEALTCKVTNFFTCPVEKEDVMAAISFHLDQLKPSLSERFRSWFNSFKDRLINPGKNKASATSAIGELNNLEILALAPSTILPFLGKEPDQENTYDISVQFFGRLQIKIRGKAVPDMKGKKNASVLAYLLLHHHRSVHRDVLTDRFWSEVGSSSAKNSLNVAIHNIRKILARVLKDQEVILYKNGSYCINPQLEIITDVEKFTYYWKKGRDLEASQGLHHALHAYNRAIGFYQEEFLENLRYEDWCESERANLREIYLFILNRLSAYFLEQENYYACINVCKKMLSTDECLEEAHRKLMKCYYSLGLMDMASKQYFKCKKVLAEELELQASQITVDLFEKMQSGAAVN
ncbi:MAG: BTAD domain-containing putative transcriptional regulator [Saprospiraceae bacterium]|nr:winged helix-turn-helix domain-containing protein [Lewinella sp.]